MSHHPNEIDRIHTPSIDRLLRAPQLNPSIEHWGRASVREAIRAIQVHLRECAVSIDTADVETFYATEIEQWLSEHRTRGYECVFNLTGTILHTNLGRALISDAMFERVRPSVTRPATIEFDLKTGKRSQREQSVCERLCRLVDAEAAAIVNNNAAAVLITLNTLARDRNVVVSRGELIEIGGSFRLPEIMETAGCRLIEVGTTNRTHIEDYQMALAENPALLLKVHPSNYRIVGFTNEVSGQSLSQLAHKHSIPYVVDLGSGALIDTRQFGLPHEPMPGDVLKTGASIVTFSGDKLLGGPQGGLIVGKQTYIDAINSNPMKRAVRMSKLTLALLDETLKAYEDKEHLIDRIPTLHSLALKERELQKRATHVHACLTDKIASPCTIAVKTSSAEVGSGALPGHSLPSLAVEIRTPNGTSSQQLLQSLRSLPIPVIGRIYKSAVSLDMHGAEPLDELIANLRKLR